MKKAHIYILTFFLILGANALVSAPPPPPAGNPPCWPPPCVPIDGGIGVLIAAGAAYGVKKLYDKKKKNTTTIS